MVPGMGWSADLQITGFAFGSTFATRCDECGISCAANTIFTKCRTPFSQDPLFSAKQTPRERVICEIIVPLAASGRLLLSNMVLLPACRGAFAEGSVSPSVEPKGFGLVLSIRNQIWDN